LLQPFAWACSSPSSNLCSCALAPGKERVSIEVTLLDRCPTPRARSTSFQLAADDTESVCTCGAHCTQAHIPRTGAHSTRVAGLCTERVTHKKILASTSHGCYGHVARLPVRCCPCCCAGDEDIVHAQGADGGPDPAGDSAPPSWPARLPA